MAKYSIELRDVVAYKGNIFNFPYEFYDEKERANFERKFIRHFYFREIGAETIDRFLLFLEDKMQTVFPYYNKMLEATKIEYNILDNYYLKETTDVKRENIGTSSGVSSTVGQIFDNQKTDTNETRDGSHTESENGGTKTTQTENGTVDTTKSGTNNTTTSQTVNGTTSDTKDEKKRYLDTPQGAVDLSDSKYLTTLNHDSATSSGSSNTKTDGTNKNTTSETGKDTTTRTIETIGSSNGSSSGSNNESSKSDVTHTGEQRSTADNNTRSRSEGSTNETIVIERKGNIGVDTDSDGIIKHLKLQEILTKIEKMFFDECEDLFMLVY